MSFAATYGIIWVVVLIAATWRLHNRRLGLGSAAAGMMDKILSEDQRQAVEIIVEERAASRDHEDAEGNLPDLVTPISLKSRPPGTSDLSLDQSSGPAKR